MALYPRQNSTFCLQHCCFELMLVFTIQYSMSIIQHCAFTNQHPYFKFSVLRLHATFVCVCAICLHRNPTFLFSVFTHQHPYFKFTFRSFKCDIHAFHCYVDVRCVCCGAECDMLAAQCNILVGHWTSRLSELTFRWYAAVQNMWAQNSCTCFLSLFQARQWWRIMWTLRTRLQRPHFVALQSSC